LEVLAANPALGRLTDLYLQPRSYAYVDSPTGGLPITLEGLRAVVNSPHLKSLSHLALTMTDFGDAGCEAIVRSGVLKRLRVLDLPYGSITNAGARALAKCPDLKHLEYLFLDHNGLTRAGLRALKATGVSVRADHQHPPGSDDYLYEGDIE